jgi:hypothetical protein|tara:strand:- start:1309 stop:1905 length:597 start_codon:yes stop_codon:yes gene_type:complete
MADQKISELVAATSAAGADLLNIVQGGSNKKLTVANLFANLDTPVIINESGGDQDTRIEGLNDNNLLYVDASTDRVGVGVATPSQKLDVNGDVAISGGSLYLSQTAQSSTGTSTADLTKAVTELTLSSGSDAASLANGTVGQIKIFVVVGGSGSCVLTPTTLNGGTTITFNAVGDAVTLLYVATVGWTVIGSNSVVVA